MMNSVKIGAINFATGGSNTVVAAAGSGPVLVWGLFLVCDSDTDLIFYNGTTAQSGPIPILGTTQGIQTFILPQGSAPWFACDPGNAFIINSSSPAVVTGSVYYSFG
jgi:hypothetical protein